MNFQVLLETLVRRDVAFALVGGAAAVVHGSTLMTQALDIVYQLEPENIRRLLLVLEDLDGVAHGDPRRLRFGFDHLNNLAGFVRSQAS